MEEILHSGTTHEDFTQTLQLRSEIREILLTEIYHRPRLALMDLHEISEVTFKDWVRSNNPQLSTTESLELLAAYLIVKIEELVEPRKIALELETIK